MSMSSCRRCSQGFANHLRLLLARNACASSSAMTANTMRLWHRLACAKSSRNCKSLNHCGGMAICIFPRPCAPCQRQHFVMPEPPEPYIKTLISPRYSADKQHKPGRGVGWAAVGRRTMSTMSAGMYAGCMLADDRPMPARATADVCPICAPKIVAVLVTALQTFWKFHQEHGRHQATRVLLEKSGELASSVTTRTQHRCLWPRGPSDTQVCIFGTWSAQRSKGSLLYGPDRYIIIMADRNCFVFCVPNHNGIWKRAKIDLYISSIRYLHQICNTHDAFDSKARHLVVI